MKKIKFIIKDYIYITLGTFFLALGLAMFLSPLKLSSGGVSTIATVMYHVFKIPLSVTNLAINIVLFIAGYKYLGKESVAKTIAGIVLLSAFLQLISIFPSYKGDMIAANLAGGIFVGIGEGLVIKREGSTGGSDFAALILNRFFPHISTSGILLMIDCTIISLSGVVFKSFAVTVYSIASLYISIKICDYICSFGDDAKTIYIVSDKSQEIADYIMEHFMRGVTGIYSKGMYLEEDKTMLMCVVSPKEFPAVVHSVRKIDRSAFITVSEVREVFGEGFKAETVYDKMIKEIGE